MSQEERIEILRLKAKQNGELIITFLLDGKKMELENLEFGKTLENYTRSKEFTEYVDALKSVNSTDLKLVRTTRGRNGGTWFHKDLAIAFARWRANYHFLLDGKKMELENLEFEKRFGDITEYQRSKKGASDEKA